MRTGWEMKTLGEISKINYGYTDSASFENIGPKFLRITDIQDNNVFWENVPYCNCSQYELPKYRLENGDIVFARTGATTGKSFLIKDPPISVFASYLIRLKILSKDIILPEFVALYFQTKDYWDKINSGVSGSAQGGFNASKLGEIKIPIPSLNEQKNIVTSLNEIFIAIATAKANTEKNLQNAQEVFDSYVEAIFMNKSEKWEVKLLKEVCEKITDGTHQTPTYFDSGVIFLSSRNVTSGKIDWNNIKYIDTKQHLEMHKRVAPRINDILLAKNGTTGVAAIVDKDITFDIYVSLALLRSLDYILPAFLLYFINSPIAKKQFNKRLKGMGVPNLHLEEIREVIISFPKSLQDQQIIVDQLDILSNETKKLKQLYQQKLNDLEELKKAFLQKAFNGELINSTEKILV